MTVTVPASLRSALACSLLLASLPLAAHAQDTAQPPAGGEGAAVLQERIAGMVGRPGGLTAEQVAARAVETSFDLAQKREQIAAAAAQVDAAIVGYFPKLTLLG